MNERISQSISIVIPAYNEEANLRDVVLDSLGVLSSLTGRYEVVVMDDASRDRTAGVVEELVRVHPGEVRLLRHEKNHGTNLSLIELFREARSDLVFFLPADKQILPDSIRRYLEVMKKEDADIVMGWRQRRADEPHRAFFNGAFCFLLKLLTGFSYHDAAASDLYKKSVLNQIKMESRGRLLQAEIASKASSLGYRVREVVVEHHPRAAGQQTGIKPKTAWLSLVDLVRLGLKIRGLKKLPERSPLHPKLLPR